MQFMPAGQVDGVERKNFRFPAIRPVVPKVTDWARYLEPSYASHWYTNFGPVSRQLEAELARQFCHPNEVMICANSATSGIAAALISLGVRGPVLVPAFTFPATVAAVVMAGAEPMVIDVEAATWSLSASLLERFLDEEQCAAVVLVSPFGLVRDFSRHIEICLENKIPIVIDNAAGLSERAGQLANEHCFEVYSLHATKPFPIGEGGVIRSRATEAPTLRRALNFGLEHGQARPGCWGINGKLPEISAAVGLAVLEEFPLIIRRRRTVAQRYIDLLNEYDALAFPRDVTLAPWQVFPLMLPSGRAAEEFVRLTALQGLQVRWSYKPTLDNWPRVRKGGPCPNSHFLSERIVTLPIYSDMTDDELTEILGITKRSLTQALSL